MSMSGWIGVDLDGTLAYYDGWSTIDTIGEPILPMVDKVKKLLAEGIEVKIFTARVCMHNQIDISTSQTINAISPIKEWCKKHIGQELEVTNIKDFSMIELWDDRCKQVIFNKGLYIEEYLNVVQKQENTKKTN